MKAYERQKERREKREIERDTERERESVCVGEREWESSTTQVRNVRGGSSPSSIPFSHHLMGKPVGFRSKTAR